MRIERSRPFGLTGWRQDFFPFASPDDGLITMEVWTFSCPAQVSCRRDEGLGSPSRDSLQRHDSLSQGDDSPGTMISNDQITQEDRGAEFIQLLGQHEPQLQSFVLSLVPHWSDADEIIQETRLRVWRQFDEYDRSKDFGTWIRTIAYYLILAYRKEEGRRAARFSQQFVDLVAEEVAAAADESQSRRNGLRDCLKQLSQQHQQLLTLCYQTGATIKDVALQLGRSVRGTQQTVARLRVLLQKCIEDVMRREGLDG